MSISLSIKKRESRQRSLITLLGIIAVWVFLYLSNEKFWSWLFYEKLSVNKGARLGGVLHFFLYDSLKITLLLVGITFVVTVLRSFITIQRTHAFLGGKRQGIGNVLAASVGVVTPFALAAQYLYLLASFQPEYRLELHLVFSLRAH